MSYIPKSEWFKGALDLANDELPIEKALGLYWNVEMDSLTFRPKLKSKPWWEEETGLVSLL